MKAFWTWTFWIFVILTTHVFGLACFLVYYFLQDHEKRVKHNEEFADYFKRVEEEEADPEAFHAKMYAEIDAEIEADIKAGRLYRVGDLLTSTKPTPLPAPTVPDWDDELVDAFRR